TVANGDGAISRVQNNPKSVSNHNNHNSNNNNNYNTTNSNNNNYNNSNNTNNNNNSMRRQAQSTNSSFAGSNLGASSSRVPARRGGSADAPVADRG
ncbi:unnamed protein product, partial [Polarella glacialis]